MIKERKYRVEYNVGAGGREVIIGVEYDPNRRHNEMFSVRVAGVAEIEYIGADLAAAIVVGLEHAADTHVDHERWASLKQRAQEGA